MPLNTLIMKHKGAFFEYGIDRDRELMKAYRKALADTNFVSIEKLMEFVVNTPSSRFWVSERRASIVLSALDKGRDIITTPSKREMFAELYSRYCAVREKFPTMSHYDIVFEIVNQPAPKFYISPNSAEVMISKIKKKWYKNKKRNIYML